MASNLVVRTWVADPARTMVDLTTAHTGMGLLAPVPTARAAMLVALLTAVSGPDLDPAPLNWDPPLAAPPPPLPPAPPAPFVFPQLVLRIFAALAGVAMLWWGINLVITCTPSDPSLKVITNVITYSATILIALIAMGALIIAPHAVVGMNEQTRRATLFSLAPTSVLIVITLLITIGAVSVPFWAFIALTVLSIAGAFTALASLAYITLR